MILVSGRRYWLGSLEWELCCLRVLMKINMNVRGAERRGFYRKVRDPISKYNPDILDCMETRVNSIVLLRLLKEFLFLISWKFCP